MLNIAFRFCLNLFYVVLHVLVFQKVRFLIQFSTTCLLLRFYHYEILRKVKAKSKKKMESCVAVEREVEKVLTKF